MSARTGLPNRKNCIYKEESSSLLPIPNVASSVSMLIFQEIMKYVYVNKNTAKIYGMVLITRGFKFFISCSKYFNVIFYGKKYFKIIAYGVNL